MKGTLLDIRPKVNEERLKVVAKVRIEGGKKINAYLPDRELAALLPRSILVGGGREAPSELLSTLLPILKRASSGRPVRLWAFKDRYYFSFLSWRNVKFLPWRKERHAKPT